MVRVSKSQVSEKKNVVEVEKMVDVVEVEVPLVVKKEKKSKKVVVTSSPVLEEVVVFQPSEVVTPLLPALELLDVSEFTHPVDSIPTKMVEFGLKLQHAISFLTAIKSSFKVLEKCAVREYKINQKAASKKNKRSGNRRPSGFVNPTLISDEMALFLGKELGTKMARTEVSKEINIYIKSHNLQEVSNGRQINSDVPLSTLLKLGPDDVLTYFNLQKFMKHHFIKTVPVVESVVA